MNFQRGRGKEPLEINLVPLIDVMMVILIFLMITTTYSKYTELQINLPFGVRGRQVDLQLGVLGIGGGDHQEDQDHHHHVDQRDQVDLERFLAPAALEVHLLPALAVNDIHQLGGLLFHLHHQALDLVLEVPVEDERRYRYADAERGVVQGDRDAVRELLRVAAGGGLRAEDLDHADH